MGRLSSWTEVQQPGFMRYMNMVAGTWKSDKGNFSSAMKGIINMLELEISKKAGKGSCVSMHGCNLLNITLSDSEDFQLMGVYLPEEKLFVPKSVGIL